MAYVHPSGPGGWTGVECGSGASAIQPSEPCRRESVRAGYSDMSYAPPAMSSGINSIAVGLDGTKPSTDADLLQSEFFIEAMRPGMAESVWANLDPCMLTAQSAERVRVEQESEVGQHTSDASLAPPGPGL